MDKSTMKLTIRTKQKIEALTFGVLTGATILIYPKEEIDAFGSALMLVILGCFLIIFALGRDVEYRPHSYAFKNKEVQSEPELEPEQESKWWEEKKE